MRPRLTSWRSRTSRKVALPCSCVASASAGVTSRMRFLASLTRSVPLFIGRAGEGRDVLLQTGGRSIELDVQLTAIGVELGARAQGGRPLIVDVAEGNAGDGGKTGGPARLGEHAIERFDADVGSVVATFGERPERDAGKPRQCTGE